MNFNTSSVLGLVSLVGAGPGDPELLTLRGLRRLEQADAVVYDRLIASELLEHCRPGAQLYDVGKAPGKGSYGRQEDINSLLVQLGQRDQRVVRLKGGDPFVFGRGGEEALALSEAGVPFEIVPGVSSAFSAPAAAGIPVTHRGLASSVTVATGHDRADAPGAGHDWEALARMRGTLVFLMAVENLEHIVDQLLRHGRPFDEPAALVRWGTTERQTVVSARLGDIATTARLVGLAPPAVLVIGATVDLAADIARSSSAAEHRLAVAS